MDRDLTAELFVPEGNLSPEAVHLIVRALLAAGFASEQTPGSGTYYWLNDDWQGPGELSAALAAFEQSSSWGLKLWMRSATDDIVAVYFWIERPAG